MENKKTDPSHKNIFKYKGLMLAAVLPFVFWGVLIAMWFFRAPEQSQPYIKTTTGDTGGLALINTSILDSDKDSLSNWEESIYGTNATNSDTDGDGYLDGEEVLSGHDPVKKGPNDFLVRSIGPERKIQTATDAFAKIALQNLLNNSQIQDLSDISPEELDAKLKESFGNDPSLAADFQKEMRKVLYDYIPIGLDDKIKISNQSTEQSLKQYTDQIIKISSESSEKYGAFQLSQIVSDAYTKKDLTKIDGAISYYHALYEKLLATPAPKDIASLHREGLLLFYETAKILEATKDWESDSVRALVSMRKYSEWIEKMKSWGNTKI